MAQTDGETHSPPQQPKRPKGILKNSASFTNPSPQISPTSERPPPAHENGMEEDATTNGRPAPTRGMSDKEITQMNTELNAGGHRRNSSNPRSSISRRHSSQSNAASSSGEQDEQNMRLKWDEANLYVNESQMGGRMKIDEPKTPYAKQYDPAEDEDEVETINAQELAVDELDMGRSQPPRRSRESEIPGLDIGEPEMDPLAKRESEGENKVIVESDGMDVDGVGSGHGEKREEDMSREEREKHKRFEEARKRHYEMRDVKNLLGHAQEDDVDDEEDENGRR